MISAKAQAALDRTIDYIQTEYGSGILQATDRNDIVEIAKKMEFTIMLTDLTQGDGYVAVDDNEILPRFNCHRLIAVNAQKSWKSKRYIIAMELSYFLNLQSENPTKKLKYARDCNVDDEHVGEEEVNNEVALLAARLLMPDNGMQSKVTELMGKNLDHKKLVLEISDYFDVPYTLADTRMDMLDSSPGEARL